jgi:hypothetical protein
MSTNNIFDYLSVGAPCYMRVLDFPKLEFTLQKSANSKYPFLMRLADGNEITSLRHLFNIYNKYHADHSIPTWATVAMNPETCVFSAAERFEDCTFETILGLTPAEWDEMPALEELPLQAAELEADMLEAARTLATMREPQQHKFDPRPIHERVACLEARFADIERQLYMLR